MEMTKNMNGSELTIALKGRLDTMTAPQLEKELNDAYAGIDKLILDFADLEYISSAGLRVLLSAQKKMMKQGEMVIYNVKEDVMEVFDITGFSDILTIC